MNINEASKIVKVFSNWYWPCHVMLFSIFMGGAPESFLPYPKDVLEEALNTIAEMHWNEGNHDISNEIKSFIPILLLYKNDEEAYQDLANMLKMPGLIEAFATRASKYKQDWDKYLEESLDNEGNISL